MNEQKFTLTEEQLKKLLKRQAILKRRLEARSVIKVTLSQYAIFENMKIKRDGNDTDK